PSGVTFTHLCFVPLCVTESPALTTRFSPESRCSSTTPSSIYTTSSVMVLCIGHSSPGLRTVTSAEAPLSGVMTRELKNRDCVRSILYCSMSASLERSSGVLWVEATT
ncbi:cupin domain-containing protein, partial [Colletotrichum scovillei]